ncbi:flagella basal body P-ring formation protein FlgA [Helicobacter cinaedi CCUG 18818 = ATCC BAA-847]|uniref:Flagella basal body P-ring formation protein FlgA n=1 Tax=Helicobacter cinaedi CCUG 18818 = ATCC BAA-847 TaxID=537971 RepID=A0ABN0BD64_9HELI|nr:flagella basal body P-ring formation protein FlgA [Helicobacter cinaedi CCUG 18818 = ATCC BAA-847]
MLFWLFASFATMGALADEIEIPKSVPSSKLHLQKSYSVSQNDIYSTDLFPQMDRKFKIASFPPDRFTLRLKSVDIKLIFQRFGYKIISFESDVVEFEFVSSMKENDALEFIQKMYIQHYGKDLQIDKILVRPLGNLPKDYTLIDFSIPNFAVKKNSGSFTMGYRTLDGERIKKLTFIYEIQARLRVAKSTQNIPSSENLSLQNVEEDFIKFERVGAEFVSIEEIQKYSAKSYIRTQMPITKDKLKPRILVKKGDMVSVFNKQEGVSIETLLVAKQSGAYNEIINAQNPDSGKILRIRIVSENKGEIL